MRVRQQCINNIYARHLDDARMTRTPNVYNINNIIATRIKDTGYMVNIIILVISYIYIQYIRPV